MATPPSFNIQMYQSGNNASDENGLGDISVGRNLGKAMEYEKTEVRRRSTSA